MSTTKLWFLTLLLTIFYSTHSFAQRQEGGQMRERLIEFTKAELTSALSLSEEQQASFFPIYQEYVRERFRIRRELKDLLDGALVKDDKALEKDYREILNLKSKEANLESVYQEKFKGILTLRQRVGLIKAEEDIKKKFLQTQMRNRMERRFQRD